MYKKIVAGSLSVVAVMSLSFGLVTLKNALMPVEVRSEILVYHTKDVGSAEVEEYLALYDVLEDTETDRLKAFFSQLTNEYDIVLDDLEVDIGSDLFEGQLYDGFVEVPTDTLIPEGNVEVAPEIPSIPDEPLIPEIPSIPDEPLTPEIPDEPLVPEIPDEPLVPEIPEDFLPPLDLPNPDWGTTVPDDSGGTTVPDGGGTTVPDDGGGTTVPDGGGTTVPDGGGGTTVPDDGGGTTVPDDGVDTTPDIEVVIPDEG